VLGEEQRGAIKGLVGFVQHSGKRLIDVRHGAVTSRMPSTPASRARAACRSCLRRPPVTTVAERYLAGEVGISA
jgi:hypothetical protein